MTYKQKKQFKFNFIVDAFINMALVLIAIAVAFVSLTSYASQITK